MFTLLRRLSSAIAVIVTVQAAPATWDAPNPGATPFNQLSVSGNACGPAALLNAFRFGDKNWQRGLEAVVGDSDKIRLSYTIRAYGLRPSAQLAGRTRWSRAGINLTDLIALGNDLTRGRYLPELQPSVLLPAAGETSPQVLKRVHSSLARSMKKGLPPIISVRRQVLRKSDIGQSGWLTVESHFITLLRLPSSLDGAATSFPIDYLDPWGGKRCSGTISLPPADAASYGLIAELPSTTIGKKLVRKGERSTLTLSAAIGRW